MSVIDKVYAQGMKQILKDGYVYEDPNRKGVIRKEIPSLSLFFDLSDGFPALSTKKVYFKGAVQELLFFLSGSTDIRDLWENGVNFWDKDWANFHNFSEAEARYVKNAYNEGLEEKESDYDMGKIYPYQYRNFGGRKDQFLDNVNTLKKNPMSTSMVTSAWSPSEIKDMCLPPCHYAFQFLGRPLTLTEREKIYNKEVGFIMIDGENIDEAYHKEFDKYNIPKYGFYIHWDQRSTDYFLGTPVNIMYYALMALLLEKITGHKALGVQGNLRNVHLYDNQFEVAQEQLDRDVTKHPNARVEFKDIKEGLWSKNLDAILYNLSYENFDLVNYSYEPKLKAEMLAYSK